jgi:hypothetical protein
MRIGKSNINKHQYKLKEDGNTLVKGVAYVEATEAAASVKNIGKKKI